MSEIKFNIKGMTDGVVKRDIKGVHYYDIKDDLRGFDLDIIRIDAKIHTKEDLTDFISFLESSKVTLPIISESGKKGNITINNSAVLGVFLDNFPIKEKFLNKLIITGYIISIKEMDIFIKILSKIEADGFDISGSEISPNTEVKIENILDWIVAMDLKHYKTETFPDYTPTSLSHFYIIRSPERFSSSDIIKIYFNKADNELNERWNYAIADSLRKK